MKNRKFKLSNSIISKIKQLEKEVEKPRLLKRLQFLLLKNQGELHRNIAKFLGVRTETLTQWLIRFRQGGLKKLMNWRFSGKPSRLTKEQQETLKDRMRHDGFVNAQEAKDFIEKRFGIIYHVRYLPRLLKKIRTILQTTSSHSRQSAG